MQRLGDLFRRAELPFPRTVFPTGALSKVSRHALDIDNGVAHEHAGQAVGQVAGQTGIAALMQESGCQPETVSASAIGYMELVTSLHSQHSDAVLRLFFRQCV